jgi:CheY-like chemotaxis protein
MNERVEVLLVGETAQSSLHLTQWLERRGCRCQFSSSCKEACNLIAGQAFDFVLSHFELPDNSAYPILEKLVGSATTLFFSKLIEDGCLWIPALSQGERWPAARVLRPREFALSLEAAIRETFSQAASAPAGAVRGRGCENVSRD